jgi:DNA polymerase-3 subunit epsilon
MTAMRQIVLDTETTGLDPEQGHRVIEIGCVELINRRLTGNDYHQYLQPDRDIDEGAQEVHGISLEFLADKPRFQDIAQAFLDYIQDAELIIHNAPFDVGFLNHELSLQNPTLGTIDDFCTVTDTLKMARNLHPGQANNLDALCKRYEIDNSQRDLHGALLDAQILADVYLAMTGGQTALFAESGDVTEQGSAGTPVVRRLDPNRPRLPVVTASDEEIRAHQAWLEKLDQDSGGPCLWRQLEEQGLLS